MFSELVAQVVVNRMPEIATINRNPRTRKGRVYIDYLQLGHGKTIAAPFSVRPLARAPVSAPMTWKELKPSLDPAIYNIETMPPRMSRMRRDPFLDAIEKHASLEDALPHLEALLNSCCGPLREPVSAHSLVFGGAVTSLNARIASTAVGTPLYCET